MEEVTIRAPGEAISLDHLGDIYFSMGRKREALYMWRQAKDLAEPEDNIIDGMDGIVNVDSENSNYMVLNYLNKDQHENLWVLNPFSEHYNNIVAIQKNDNQVHEAADVLYHLLVLLEGSDIKIEDVMAELKKRQNGIR